MFKNLKKLIIPVLATLLIGGGAQAAYWQWSKTSSSNANADPSINWAEGMSPSSVNDSARAMMARAAEQRDDISGSLTTGGTATAYTITTNQGFASVPTDGQLIAFTVHATNGINATLQADGGTTYQIQSAVGVNIGAGTIILGSPYTAKFNLSAAAWILRDFYGNPYALPLGGLLNSTVATPPNSSFILPAGQCISRTAYATYFALVSTTFGACDGVTTFAAPDLRGRNQVALDNLNGSAANRMTNNANGCGVAFTSVGAVCGQEGVTLSIAQMPSHTHTQNAHNHGLTALLTSGTSGGVPSGSAFSTAVTVGSNSTDSATATNQNTGGGGQHPTVQPSFAVTVFLRVI